MRHKNNSKKHLIKNEMDIQLKNVIDNWKLTKNNFYVESGLNTKKEKYNVIKKYNNIINYNSGLTNHYEYNRLIREQELIRLLGEGKPIAAFLVDDNKNGLQIQEILDNAVIVVYSFSSHKKITLFAPEAERICKMFETVGEIAPEQLILKSEDNFIKGYNEIFCL